MHDLIIESLVLENIGASAKMFNIVEAEPGQHVADFASEMVALAYRLNMPILGEFNQYTLEARPGMTTEDVLKPWNEDQRRSYFG